ncbi:MAG: response regulator [Ginsengibacter sp.]
MNVIIIDDEILARNIVKNYLEPYSDIHIVAECGDGFEGLKAIQQLQPDLIFLDIQMPKINGFEMLELIEEPPAVIFTTAFDEYALKAFEINAADYLLKPFSKERCEKAISNYRENAAAPSVQKVLETIAQTPLQENRVVVKDGNKIKIIPINKIQYLEAADDYVKIITADGTYLKKRTMAFYEESLRAHHFVRVHRSFIANTSLITRIEPYEKDSHLLLLNTGAKLPISKSGYSKLRVELGI